MVLDAAKGIEPQTLKLFEVCRLRDIPIMTFINKMDREAQRPVRAAGRDPRPAGAGHRADELADRHGPELQGRVRPRHAVTTCLLGEGSGLELRGRGAGSAATAWPCVCREAQLAELDEQLALVEGALPEFRSAELSRGPPDAGVLRLCACAISACGRCWTGSPTTPPRRGRSRARRRTVEPGEDKVTGFVFKVQANMDPKHRDRVAFVRLCSGRFQRGMKLNRSGTASRSRSPTRSCSSPASARSPRRPGPATSSASPTTASCGSATRSPRASRCASPASPTSRPRS